MAEDTRNRRAGVTQMGEADGGNLVMFTGNARIEDSGISVEDLKQLMREVRELLLHKRKAGAG